MHNERQALASGKASNSNVAKNALNAPKAPNRKNESQKSAQNNAQNDAQGNAQSRRPIPISALSFCSPAPLIALSTTSGSAQKIAMGQTACHAHGTTLASCSVGLPHGAQSTFLKRVDVSFTKYRVSSQFTIKKNCCIKK